MKAAHLASAIVAATITLASGAAQAYPWCILGGGGKFLCTDKDERMQLAKDSAQLPYLEFVQRAFVADTIRYVPLPGDGSYAATEHRGGGGINLSAATNSSVRERIRMAASEWFHFYCFAKGGKAVRYPINDDADLTNVDRFACHPKSEKAGEVIAGEPMFGMQGSKSTAFGGIEKDPVIVMYHLGNGAEVKKRWGYPKVWKPGDSTNLGTIIEVKVPQAKMKTDSNTETWVKLVELEPVKP